MSTLAVLIIIVGVIALQVFLSGRESKWPGLVLPIMAFLFSFLYPLSMTAPTAGVNVVAVVQLFLTFVVGNIPTGVFLSIYFACRKKQHCSRQLDKMKIQDLD